MGCLHLTQFEKVYFLIWIRCVHHTVGSYGLPILFFFNNLNYKCNKFHCTFCQNERSKHVCEVCLNKIVSWINTSASLQQHNITLSNNSEFYVIKQSYTKLTFTGHSLHFKTLIHVTSKITYGCQPHNYRGFKIPYSQIVGAMRYQWTIGLWFDVTLIIYTHIKAFDFMK